MQIHVNQIKFEEKDAWSEAMNRANYWYERYLNESFTEAERDEAFQMWKDERMSIETGMYAV